MIGKIDNGGLKVHGVVEKYKVAAGENVRAGDFVEFIKDVEVSNDTLLNSSSFSGRFISAVALDEKRVFIAHSVDTPYYLYGCIVTIDNSSMAISEDIQLSTMPYSGYGLSTTLIGEDKIFISFSTNSHNMYGLVCVIENETIDCGYCTLLQSYFCGDRTSVEKIDENKVFIALGYTETSSGVNQTFYALHGLVCKINGLEIISGNLTKLYTNNSTEYDVSVVVLEANKVFIAHSCYSYYELNGIVCTIDDTEITSGTNTTLYSLGECASKISATLVSKDKVFIACSRLSTSSSSTSNSVYGVACTITDMTISAGEGKVLAKDEVSKNGGDVSVVSFGKNRVQVFYSGGLEKGYLYGIGCEVYQNTIYQLGVKQQLSDIYHSNDSISAVCLNKHSSLIMHSGGKTSSSYYLMFGMLYDLFVRSNNDYSDRMLGIAKTSGKNGQQIKVIAAKNHVEL